MQFSLFIKTTLTRAKRFFSFSRFDLYLLYEFCIHQLFALAFIFVILLVNNFLVLAENLLSKKAAITDVVMLIISFLPSTIVWALPFSSLIGALLAIGRLSSDNEILAGRILGMPYRALLKPFLLYSLGIILISFTLMNLLAPIAGKSFKKTYTRILQSSPQLFLSSYGILQLGKSTLILNQVKNNQILGLTIIDQDHNGNERVIYAKQATIPQKSHKNNPQRIGLNMESIQGIITPPPYDAMIYQTFSASHMYYRLPAADSVGTGSTTADDKTLPQLWRDLIQAKAIVEQQLYEQKQASLHWLESMHDYYLQNILVDTPQNDQINLFYNRYLQEKSRKISQEFYKAKVIDFYQHFSLPTACFIFTFLAFSIAIQAPKMHQMLVLALGALLCIAYWFSLFLVIHAVMVLNFPLWFVVASDASFLLVAIILYIRLGR